MEIFILNESIEKQIIEIVTFDSETEKKRYDEYIKTSGIGNCYFAAIALRNYTNKNHIEYSVFSSLIRYDKSLREQMYKWLSTFEEAYKEKLFKRLEYSGGEIELREINNDKIRDFQIINGGYGINFYKSCELTLGGIIQLINLKKEINVKEDEISHLKRIKKLRDSLMHHQFILIDKSSELTPKSIDKNIKVRHLQIESLLSMLDLSHRKTLIESLNQLTDKTSSPIKLEKFQIEVY